MVQLQKIVGAVLFALIAIVAINLGGDAVERVLTPQRHLARAEPAPPPNPSTPGTPAPAPAQTAAAPGAVKKCAACHTFEQGGANRTGPNLFGVVGRDIASLPGFAYSDALKGLPGDWTEQTLDAFIANPKAVAPGTKMGFAGEADAQARAAIIAYMTSLK